MAILSNLVWIFQEHRDLSRTCTQLLREVQDRDRTISDLEQQLTVNSSKPSLDPASLKELTEQLFQDEPYPDNAIPDNVWLTPGPPERATR